jgi:hypothetical protein
MKEETWMNCSSHGKLIEDSNTGGCLWLGDSNAYSGVKLEKLWLSWEINP